MRERALWVPIWLFAFFYLATASLAEDPDPGKSAVLIPPAPASEDIQAATATESTEALDASSDTSTDQEFVPTPAPTIDEESSIEILPAPGDEIAVPPANSDANAALESTDIEIQVGPESGEPRQKLDDFSYTRWWPMSGSFQWVPGHRDRFGILSLVGQSGVAWENWEGLSSTSGYGFHFLNGPVSTDLPSKLFDFTWGLNWGGEIMPGWSASIAGNVGIYTDFEDSVRDGWRFPAHAVVFHDLTEEVRGVLGVRYFDRENLVALPELGVILRPDEKVRLELVFPEPRVAWRVHSSEGSENWLSISGEIGGGEWAIERSNSGLADVVTYNDYSAVLGFHRYKTGEGEQAFEIGYLFARDLEYRSGVGNFEPEQTVFLRLSSHF